MPISATPNYVIFAISSSLTGIPTPEFPQKLLPTLTHTFGRQFQRFFGRPMTRFRLSLGTSDTKAHVESTLGFPESGQFWAEGILFTYSSKTDASFDGVSSEYRPYIIARGAEIVLNIPSAAVA